MIATLRKKNQVTIPATIIKKLGLHEGNDIQIVEKMV
jgi:AbrB family looped-hinge helix DNA binding protein